MKKLIFALCLIISVTLLFSCNNTEENNDEMNIQSENIETNDETPEVKESVEEHEQEEVSIVEEEPKQEEKPIIKEEPKQEEKPVIKEEPKQEEKPVIKEEPKQEEKPVIKEEPKQEEKPVIKEEPKQEEKPVIKEEPKQEVVKKENIVSNVETLYVKSKDIAPITESSVTIDKAEIITYSGAITTEDQIDKYAFTVPRDGLYRFELSGIKADTSIKLSIFDSLGNIASRNNFALNSGLTLYDLKKGDVYEIQVKHYKNFGNYTLSIGHQKPIADVTEYSKITDSIEFTGQINVYTFTVPRDGLYRFELSGIKADTSIKLSIFDSLGNIASRDNFALNSSGLTLYDLKKGDVYEIQVEHYKNFGNYTLSIGHQKPIADVTEYSKITDSIEFTGQINVYTFTVPRDGLYRFELSGIKADTSIKLSIFDSLGNIASRDNFALNSGLTLYDLKKGDVYEIQVKHYKNFGNYALSIGYQKPNLDISNADKIKGNISFTDQRDVYTFTAKDTSAKTFKLSEMKNECNVEFVIFNDLGEIVSQDNYAVNGDTVTIKEPVDGKTYEIQVRQKSAYSDYTITLS